MLLGGKLKSLREQNLLSKEDIALQLGVELEVLNKWENNKSMPDIEKIEKIASLYSIPVGELLNGCSESIDWTKVWSKKYPILDIYPHIDGIEVYQNKMLDMYRTCKCEFGFTDEEAVLVLKDILYKAFKKEGNV